jgi:hypothetical protein
VKKTDQLSDYEKFKCGRRDEERVSMDSAII